MTWDPEALVNQLSALGRDLDKEVTFLGELDINSVEAEGEYRRLDEEYNDRFSEEFLNAEGAVEYRKHVARLKAKPARLICEDAWLEWNRAKAKLRTQQASIAALHRRVEIGRSMLSREKALIAISGVTES